MLKAAQQLIQYLLIRVRQSARRMSRMRAGDDAGLTMVVYNTAVVTSHSQGYSCAFQEPIR